MKDKRKYRNEDGTYRSGISKLNVNLASANKIPFTPPYRDWETTTPLSLCRKKEH